MTNKEAIKWFKGSPAYHKDHEPFNMAIKALETLDEIMEYLNKIDTVVYPRTRGWIDCIKQIYNRHMEEERNLNGKILQ